MQRNSTTIFIQTPSGDFANPCITPVPWVNNAPDFTGIAEPTLSVLKAAYERDKNSIEIIPSSVPVPLMVPPDWEGLTNQCLGGALHSLFQRLTIAAFGDNGISTARGDITDAILTVRIEAALQSALSNLVTYTAYRFTNDEKILWNSTVASLNFSSAVYLL
jgi:hypothetical protein